MTGYKYFCCAQNDSALEARQRVPCTKNPLFVGPVNEPFCIFFRWQPVGGQLRGPELQQFQLRQQGVPGREELTDAVVRSREHDGVSW